jgi:predicted RNA methylase
MKQNIIEKIFPPMLDNINVPKYDQEGVWSITYPKDADNISNLIKSEIGINSIILDATAGIGGNTISFAKKFKHVVSVEQCKIRFELLKHNVSVYNLDNVTLINADCLDWLKGNYHGYFFDPPWGGPDYKYKPETKIKLGIYTMEEIVHKIKNENNKPIFIKLPFNYDLSEFDKFNYKIDKIKNYQMITIYRD